MAHTKSAKKKIHQYENQRLRNSAAKTRIKNSARKVKASLEQKDAESSQTAYRALCSALDKAAKKGTIKKQTAIRRKARAALALKAAIPA